jgi:hypothetical protein
MSFLDSSLNLVPGASSGASDLEKNLGSKLNIGGVSPKEAQGKYDYFDQSKSIDQRDKDAAALAASKANKDVIAGSEMNAYYHAMGIDPVTGQSTKDLHALTQGQGAQLSNLKSNESAAAKSFLAEHGMSGSSIEQSMLAKIQNDALITGENLRALNYNQAFNEAETHFKNAAAMMDASNQELAQMIQMHNQTRQENTQAFTSLMTVIGTYYGGAAGGAAVNTLLKDKTSSGLDTSSITRQDTSMGGEGQGLGYQLTN